MAFRNPARIGGGPAYLWMAARAKNALRRLAVLGGVGSAVFVIAIIAFVLVPKKASRRARVVASQIEPKLDSTPATQLRNRLIASMVSADSALTAARGARDTTTVTTVDTLSPAM